MNLFYKYILKKNKNMFCNYLIISVLLVFGRAFKKLNLKKTILNLTNSVELIYICIEENL